jgi:pimeloyl-ACP methyl ester carboxylesterase
MDILQPLKPRPPGARKKSLSERLITADRPPVTHGYFKSFDGTKLFYSIEGQGKPLIFCYGLVCSSLHWTYQIEHFARNYKAVWFDYRGHQNSETPADLKSLTVDAIGKDLGLLLDELGIQDAVFLGHSMGVNVVLDFYRKQPHRVAGMVLANGTARSPLETLFYVNAFQRGFAILKKIYQTSPELVSFLWKMQKGNPIARTIVTLGGFNPYLTPAADIELYVQQVAEMDPAILVHLIDSYENFDATNWLHEIKVPTLVIAGEHDRMIPLAEQERMRQIIPNSKLEIIRHGSHCPQMDLPDLVNHKIESFLRENGYTSEAREPGLQTKPASAASVVPSVRENTVSAESTSG